MNERDKIEKELVFDIEGVSFMDLFNLEEIQRFQDLFADTHDVASIIIHPDGSHITTPSKYTHLCNDIIRATEKGCANCFHSDAILSSNNPSGPTVQHCLSGGLLHAGASISVGGKHIANWIIGQVYDEAINEEQMLRYSDQIGANREDFKHALQEVPKMSAKKFNKIAQLLFVFANELSIKSYNKLKLQFQIVQNLKSKLQYDDLVSNIPVGVYILRSKPEGTFALDYVSPKMAEMLDLSIESLTSSGDAIFKAIHPDDLEGFIRLNEKGIQQKRSFDWKGRVVIKGVERWLHFRSKPQELKCGDILWHGLIVDITERMIADAEIRYQNGELVKLNAEKDKFFSIIAHDLRSPFNSFLGLTQIMAEELPSLTMSQLQEIAVKMSKSATNLYRLLENLLEWSQIKNGTFSFNPEVLQLSFVVDGCIDMIHVSSKNKDIEIVNNIAAGIEVFADRNMIQTIIRNLVSNALKFTPKGGKVNIAAITNGNQKVEIAIQDSGIGMNKNLIENLFRIDKKTNRLGTENEPSSGLGLLLCKEFVEKHEGKIWVESEVGKGSTFTFSIPKA